MYIYIYTCLYVYIYMCIVLCIIHDLFMSRGPSAPGARRPRSRPPRRQASEVDGKLFAI